MKSSRPLRCVVAPLLLVLLATGASWAATGGSDEPEAKPEKKEPATEKAPDSAILKAAREESADDDVIVFTNDDLDRFSTGRRAADEKPPSGQREPGPTPRTKPGEKPSDPLDWMKQQQEQEERRREAIAAAEQQVVDAEARVAEMEKRLLATKNPFLARPGPPESTDEKRAEEEAAEWDRMDGSERVSRSEQDLQQAREDLARARDERARLRAAR